MKTEFKCKSTLALTGVLTFGCAAAAVAGATEPSPDASCHGQVATYIGTGGNDVISDETTDLGRNPVLVLGEVADELQVGLSYESLDSLTVCAGPGSDSVEVYDGIGGHTDALLDGGTDDDFVGSNDDSRYSYLAAMASRTGPTSPTAEPTAIAVTPRPRRTASAERARDHPSRQRDGMKIRIRRPPGRRIRRRSHRPLRGPDAAQPRSSAAARAEE